MPMCRPQRPPAALQSRTGALVPRWVLAATAAASSRPATWGIDATGCRRVIARPERLFTPCLLAIGVVAGVIALTGASDHNDKTEFSGITVERINVVNADGSRALALANGKLLPARWSTAAGWTATARASRACRSSTRRATRPAA